MGNFKNQVHQTECIFHQYTGSVEEKSDYYVIRTPTNSTFWFGNFVILKKTPEQGDFEKWMRIRDFEFGESSKHAAFAWDSEKQGNTKEFEERGFELQKCISLSMSEYLAIPETNQQVEIRKLTNDRQWEMAIQLQIKIEEEEWKLLDDRDEFRKNRYAALRKMSEAGHGDWWGAFIGDELTCTMGLYFDASRQLGRFQNVATAIQHRRKGICATLLDALSRYAFGEVGVSKLIINTGDEEDNPAISVYRSCGFTGTIKNFSLSIGDRSKIKLIQDEVH